MSGDRVRRGERCATTRRRLAIVVVVLLPLTGCADPGVTDPSRGPATSAPPGNRPPVLPGPQVPDDRPPPVPGARANRAIPPTLELPLGVGAAAPAGNSPEVGATAGPATGAGADAPGRGAARYGVGERRLGLARTADRPLPTTVWYPAVGPAGGAPRRNAAMPARRFPVVLLSHGLRGLPEHFAAIAGDWASAGFVVAAPAYPYTNKHARPYRRSDMVHQPADAAYLIGELRRLDRTPGHPLAGRLATGRIAAVGYSAGGYTTTGLLTAGHDPALRAGVVIAGWGHQLPFGGRPARMLFVHGSADTIVPWAAGRAAYHRVPWPKAFLTLPGQGHGRYLRPGNPAYTPTAAVITDFLRWTLSGDRLAGDRLSVAVTPPGVAEWDAGHRW